MVLCTRGCKPAADPTAAAQGAVTWSSDPRLLSPGRQLLSDAEARSFIAGCRKIPVLMVTSRDGLYGEIGLARSASNAVRRQRLEQCFKDTGNLTVSQMSSGGHHPHLTEPSKFYNLVKQWVSGTAEL